MEMTEEDLTLKFSHNIIEHLGIKLYQNKPTNVIAELVSNSWDADAKNVWINIVSDGDEATVSVEDNGHGMTRADIVHKYLVIGKPKRKKENPMETSPSGRFLMGRKGIGKLAPFGIASVIDVVTVTIKDGPSSFRVEHNTHNDSWSSSPVGMCAGRWSACAHVHRAGLSR
ncbi:ATP-binding protein, partial [Burkholderia multivorans]|uniref:ATP-binding protein n=1 Tax=Burkholderia multivorans TaxID=87883 RepID=UPI0037364CC1